MRTKTTAAFIGALLLTSTAFAQSNEADSTDIFGTPRVNPNWQGAGYYNQPSQPTPIPVYELPNTAPAQPPVDPYASMECGTANGCADQDKEDAMACASGLTQYCHEEPDPFESMECSLENGCSDQAKEDAMACASGLTEYCK